MKEPVYIVDGARTPIGNPYRSLKGFSAAELAAVVIKGLISRCKLKKNSIDEIILGNTVSAGTGQNLTRQAALAAGVPNGVACYTVNNVCGAGLQSVILASRAILAGEANLIIAGGTESATQAPMLTSQEDLDNENFENTTNSSIYDGLMCQITNKSMGELVERTAQQKNISRDDQDFFSLDSHQKACHAQAKGILNNEIIPLKVSGKTIKDDDRPRKNLDLESFSFLPPSFKKGGTITAGNSSVPCDGAAGVVIASQGGVDKYGLAPRAEIVDYINVGVDPRDTFEASIEAIRAILKRNNLKIKDICVFELAEAFAAQALLTMKTLDIPRAKLNVFGGDIAFGHPLGAAGTRVLVSLVNALYHAEGSIGIACVPYGGGGAIAMIVKRSG